MSVGGGPSLRVCVAIYDQGRTAAIAAAEEILPALLQNIPVVEAMATATTGSTSPATILDVWIYPDGTASYTCGFLEGESDGELMSVKRSADGHLEPPQP
ncbi:hypothetical protein [Pseudoxanthomonas sp. LH2527]|uniref:hypothetical protein n=1 Tax=Pseudoxanthomonas sp. LH2527 TaxID=2923249 RepID=UPI001F12B442|nr:hypothetical protein [Pseudoxanthomonas sp. LH2527]